MRRLFYGALLAVVVAGSAIVATTPSIIVECSWWTWPFCS